jgi:choline dehydrogenase-like flavoprotein
MLAVADLAVHVGLKSACRAFALNRGFVYRDRARHERIVSAQVCRVRPRPPLALSSAEQDLLLGVLDSGLRIVVLEAGPRVPVAPDEAGMQADFVGGVYRGATEGRFFGLGGTTSRWGGQFLPFRSTDAQRGPEGYGDSWQHVIAVADLHGAIVSDALGLPTEFCAPKRVDARQAEINNRLETHGLACVTSAWLPFGRRNLSWLVRQRSTKSTELTIYCNAVAAQWHLAHGSGGVAQVSQVEARSRTGKRLRIKASHFVVAVGAIESSRVLQEINLAGAGRVVNPRSALGRYLSDHLSFRAADVATTGRRLAASTFGPTFDRGMMRTPRWTDARPESDSRRYFAHLTFDIDTSGFRLAKSVLLDLQARRLPKPRIGDLANGVGSLLQLGWARWARLKLHIPEGTSCHLQLDMEQRPHSENRVRSEHLPIRIGRPVAVIQWKVMDSDVNDASAVAPSFLSRSKAAGQDLPQLCEGATGGHSAKPTDVYHPIGTCRLGDDLEAVVGPDLRVHGIGNTYLLSTAIFPSAGTANPTYNLLCFAAMLANRLGKARQG